MMETVDLAYEELGKDNAQSLIILHGFFASSRNWRKISEALAKTYHVYAPDMRNHGLSPHNPRMDYPSMAADVLHFMEVQSLKKAHVLGHSMGGKIAMWLALNHPNRINKLVVADISPKQYNHSFNNTIQALKDLPLAEINNRKDAEIQLEQAIPELSYRQFLLQNLVLINGNYQWRVNLGFFLREASNIAGFPDSHDLQPYMGETLFLAGSESNFVAPKECLGLFPNAEFHTIADAGHWLHSQQPEVFVAEVEKFLQTA